MMAEHDAALFDQFVARRIRGEPVSRIAGQREFYGRCFDVTPDVLDPRADTETLIDAVLPFARALGECRILDAGTGSGAIIVTLLAQLPLASGVATDLSEAALAVARRNAVRHQVDDRLELLQTRLGKRLRRAISIWWCPIRRTYRRQTLPALMPRCASMIRCWPCRAGRMVWTPTGHCCRKLPGLFHRTAGWLWSSGPASTMALPRLPAPPGCKRPQRHAGCSRTCPDTSDVQCLRVHNVSDHGKNLLGIVGT
jgi:hypothetical protein